MKLVNILFLLSSTCLLSIVLYKSLISFAS